MNASIVIGQSNFSAASINQGGAINNTTLNNPAGVLIAGSKMIIADNGNNRVLIFNQIPTTNNVSADVVIGQPDMTSSGTGCTQSRFKLGEGRIFYNGKLYIADSGNNRVLVYNSIPTQNGAPADLVIGQPNFTTCTSNTGGISGKTLSTPLAVGSDGNHLLISDFTNNRVLIYNTIPSANNPSANVVIGQPNFTASTPNQGNQDSNTLSGPIGLSVNNDKSLDIGDSANARILVFNGIPQSSNAFADNVIGQTSFTFKSPTQKKGSKLSAPSLQPTEVTTDSNGTVFAAERTFNRVTIFSAFSQIFGPQPDIAIGQPDMVTIATNSGTLVGPATLSNVRSVFSNLTQLFVADSGNNRILIYNNSLQTPNLSVNNAAQGQPDATVTISGTASVNSSYTIKDIQFSINGGGFYDAVSSSTSGLFQTPLEGFSYNLDPLVNNNTGSGYTAKVRAFDSNADMSNLAFYFQPFFIAFPDDNTFTTNPYPTFEFGVNTQRTVMRDGLSKYQILIAKLATPSTWQVYLDNIPVDFASVASNLLNTAHALYNTSSTEGIYDTSSMRAAYTQNSSDIVVAAKEAVPLSFDQGGKQLSGAYKWKVVAVDNAGHTQETNSQLIRVNTKSAISTNVFFPLSILSISGVSESSLSSLNQNSTQQNIITANTSPTFYGIAPFNATITLSITDTSCDTTTNNNCTQFYQTTARSDSRFGINLPDGSLTLDSSYTTYLTSQLGGNYTESPQFTLLVQQKSVQENVQGIHTKKPIISLLHSYSPTHHPFTPLACFYHSRPLLSGFLPLIQSFISA